jgi:ribonucleoside-diphosphate reductase alpha chain
LPEETPEAEENTRPVLSVPDTFMETALTGHGFMVYEDGAALHRVRAETVYHALSDAIWSSSAPQVFFSDNAGAEACSAPGGFVFEPGHQAPYAAIDLAACKDAAAIKRAAKLAVIALDVFATSPALVLGLNNIASFLMARGIAYDSDEGRATAAMAMALAEGAATEASARIAAARGAYEGFAETEKDALHYIRKRAASVIDGDRRAKLKPALCPDRALTDAAKRQWQDAYDAARLHGLRHRHLTGIATPYDVQVMMGAAANDIAPLPAVLQGKTLAEAAASGLDALGYTRAQIDDIALYAGGHGTLQGAPAIDHAALKQKGFDAHSIDAVEHALQSAAHINHAFNIWTLGADFCVAMLGFDAATLEDPAFDMLQALGFSEDDIEAANLYACGSGTIEGAPHLRSQHLAVFDCAAGGIRAVSPQAQIRMQAAVEVFLSGACANDVMLPSGADIDDVQKLLLLAWESGIKRLSLARHGASLLSAGTAAAQITTSSTETATAKKLSTVSYT